MARKQKYDPLALIPSADVVRRRILELNDEAARLGILLRTAEELERDRRADPDVSDADDRRKGGGDER